MVSNIIFSVLIFSSIVVSSVLGGDDVITVFLRGSVSAIGVLGDGLSVTVVSLSHILGTIVSELLGNNSPAIVVLGENAFELFASDVIDTVGFVSNVELITVV